MRNIGGGCSLLLFGLHDFPFSQAIYKETHKSPSSSPG